MNGTMSKPICVMLEASWNLVMGFVDWFKYLLTAVVTEGKKAVRDETLLCTSVVRDMVPIVLLIIQVMVILSILQSA